MRQRFPKPRGELIGILIVLLILAAIFIGLGFVVKWLFIAAVVALLLAAISWFAARRNTV